MVRRWPQRPCFYQSQYYKPTHSISPPYLGGYTSEGNLFRRSAASHTDRERFISCRHTYILACSCGASSSLVADLVRNLLITVKHFTFLLPSCDVHPPSVHPVAHAQRPSAPTTETLTTPLPWNSELSDIYTWQHRPRRFGPARTREGGTRHALCGKPLARQDILRGKGTYL